MAPGITIRGNRELLAQALSNLIDNAIKYGGDAPAPDTQTTIRALGAKGLRSFADWRDLGVPRGVLLASPAVWQGAELVAAPLVGRSQNWQAVLERGEDAFFAAHMTH